MSAILDKHAALAASGVDLGDPRSVEEAFPDGGSKQVFERGSIYFHARRKSAYACRDAILAAYVALGEGSSSLGYPRADDADDPAVPGGQRQDFEGGTVFADASRATRVEYADLKEQRQIVVKVVDALPLALEPAVLLDLDGFGAAVGLSRGDPLLETVRALLPEPVVRRLFDDMPDEEVKALEVRARANDPSYQPPLWSNFLVFDEPAGIDARAVVSALNLWVGVVELAYRMPQVSDPAVVGRSNRYFDGLGYLGAAPQGIGAQAAWAFGADGSGFRFIDLEQGWLFKHEDLPQDIPLLGGRNSAASRPHGTAVLGLIVGLDNGEGGVGLAPAASARADSYADPALPGSNRSRIASHIRSSAKHLRFGDVLLIEVSLDDPDWNEESSIPQWLPAEIDRAVYEAIKFVVKCGVIVVEAAGNGTVDMDAYRRSGKAILKAGDPDDQQSGAIVVGSCHSNVVVKNNQPQHERLTVPGVGSTYGSRVDCCAWGEYLIAPGSFDAPADPHAYFTGPGVRDYFGGTSGASAIITGVCLLVQHLQQLIPPSPGVPTGALGPKRMRAILSNTANGTQTVGVGPMPDFVKILKHEFLQFTLHLHIKLVADTPASAVDQMLANAQTLFAPHGITIVEASREVVDSEGNDLTRFQTLFVADHGEGPSADMSDLFELRSGANPTDIVCYIVRTLVPASAGTAAHPPGKPGVVISATLASPWTLAHELGHLLGLEHVADPNHLMTSGATAAIATPTHRQR